MAEQNIQPREDKAEVKRIELNVHTQMSAMDSVVSTRGLIRTAVRWGWDAVAITDHGVVQAFPEAMNYVKDYQLDIKVIYGMEGYLTGEDFKKPRASHVTILVKNQEGLRRLYQLVSLSHLRYFHQQPRIPKQILQEHREGLLIGSACVKGELVRAIAGGRSDDELLEIASFYDFLEIQPIGNYAGLVCDKEFPSISTEDDLRNINRKIVELAKKLGKILVATGNVHFLNPEDAVCRAVIMASKGREDADSQPSLFLRTTEEMMNEFEYLGAETAYEAVVINTQRIAEMIEMIKPLPDKLHGPTLPNAEDEIKEMAYQRAHQWYGDKLPKIVEDRLEQELTPILAHGFSTLYLIAHKLAKHSNEAGHPVNSRGLVGASFIATMTGITEVNPLPPHWRCSKCQYSEFVTDGLYDSGFDLPDKICPNCGEPLIKDGHDISFAVFLGAKGDKEPDIVVNFTEQYSSVAREYMKRIFGKDKIYGAGTLSTISEKASYSYVQKYFEQKGMEDDESIVQRIAEGCVGTKKASGVHPASVMIVPQDMDVSMFTPLQHPDNKKDSDIIATHFDYHSLSWRLVKVDLAWHYGLMIIKKLADMTGCNPSTIPFNDPKTLSLFRSTEALGIPSELEEELDTTVGTYGIPEFESSFSRHLLHVVQPTCFSDLVKIAAMPDWEGVWRDNLDLICDGVCTMHDAIATRDDIMAYLLRKGFDPLMAFETMERIRKGKGLKPDMVKKLKEGGVPDWYIETCQKIRYLRSRAHEVSYVMLAYRIAYYKVHFPSAFYKAYFSVRSIESDADVISAGKEALKKRLEEQEALQGPSFEEASVLVSERLSVLRVALEMLLRGFTL